MHAVQILGHDIDPNSIVGGAGEQNRIFRRNYFARPALLSVTWILNEERELVLNSRPLFVYAVTTQSHTHTQTQGQNSVTCQAP